MNHNDIPQFEQRDGSEPYQEWSHPVVDRAVAAMKKYVVAEEELSFVEKETPYDDWGAVERTVKVVGEQGTEPASAWQVEGNEYNIYGFGFDFATTDSQGYVGRESVHFNFEPDGSIRMTLAENTRILQAQLSQETISLIRAVDSSLDGYLMALIAHPEYGLQVTDDDEQPYPEETKEAILKLFASMLGSESSEE